MRVALVHDYLVQDGGAERVLRVLHEMYPQAPLFTLFHRAKSMGRFFDARDIRTSFLQHMPFGVRHYQWYLPLMPLAVERLPLHDYDVVISSSSAFAKGVITNPKSLHLCFCHTPTRYLWTESHSYVEELPYPSFVKALIPPLLARLRIWDRLAADRVDYFIANSHNVQARIKKYYRRPSTVIYPPVEVEKFAVSGQAPARPGPVTTLTGPGLVSNPYFLTGGRLVSYKRFDIVIRAFNALGIPLKIFGSGPEEAKLKGLAKPHVMFLGKITDEEKASLYAHASAFIHPQVEDFGITAVESMASGRPVIAYGQGGACESIVPGTTGVLFDEQTWECLADTVIRFNARHWDPVAIRAHALKFSKEVFIQQMRGYVEARWQEFQKL